MSEMSHDSLDKRSYLDEAASMPYLELEGLREMGTLKERHN